MRYLKGNGNIYYKDIIIPKTKKEIEAKKLFLNQAVDRIITNVSNSSSGIVFRLAAEVRGNQQLSAEGGEEVLLKKGVTVESIIVTKWPVNEDVETQVFTGMSDPIVVNYSILSTDFGIKEDQHAQVALNAKVEN